MPNPYQPTAQASLSPTFRWPSVPGAATYRFYLEQNKASPTPNIVMTPVQASDNGECCSYTPLAPTFPIPLVNGHYATWWIEAYNSSGALIAPPGSVKNSFWAASVGSTFNNDFNLGYVDQFDSIGCLYHPAGSFTDAGRRVIDLFLAYNNGAIDPVNSFGFYAFPENTWSTFNISDVVPGNARAVKISMQLITSSFSQITNADPDLLGFNFQRYGCGVKNIPSAVARYSVCNRTPVEIDVPVGQDQYGDTQLMALWSHVANGIDVAATNQSVVTGRAFSGSIVGYYA